MSCFSGLQWNRVPHMVLVPIVLKRHRTVIWRCRRCTIVRLNMLCSIVHHPTLDKRTFLLQRNKRPCSSINRVQQLITVHRLVTMKLNVLNC
jgi:hypothetical protein